MGSRLSDQANRKTELSNAIKIQDTIITMNKNWIDKEIEFRKAEAKYKQEKQDHLVKIHRLRYDRGFRGKTWRDKIQGELNEIEQLIRVFESESKRPSSPTRESDVANCPVCLKIPDGIVLECQQCENMICGDCGTKLENCPICRQDLKENPLKRNKMAEKLIQSMKSN